MTKRELEQLVRLKDARIAALEQIVALYRQWRLAPVAKAKARGAEESP